MSGCAVMFENAAMVTGRGAVGGAVDDVGGFEGERARASKAASTCARSVRGAWTCG